MKTLDSPKNQTNKLFVFSVKSKKEKKKCFSGEYTACQSAFI